MSHLDVLSRIYNTPLLITQEKLNIITSKVGEKLLLNLSVDPLNNANSYKYIPSFESDPNSGIGVVPVVGTLVNKNGTGDSGSTSYQRVERDTVSLLNNGYETILYDIGSPGGEAAGLPSTMDFIASLANDGIKTVGYTNGMACSAAYGLFSACSQKFSSKSAVIGSIGTIISLLDLSKHYEENGIKQITIRSRPNKALGMSGEVINGKTIEHYQDVVNDIDKQFTDTILKYNSKITIDNIDNAKGESFIANKDSNLTFIDGFVSNLNELKANINKSASTNIYIDGLGDKTMTKEQLEVRNKELEDKLVTLKEANTDLVNQLEVESKFNEENVTASVERERIIGIIKAAETFGLSNELAMKRVDKGSSLEDTVELFTAIAEESGKSTENLVTGITNTVTSTDTSRVVSLGETKVDLSSIATAFKKQA